MPEQPSELIEAARSACALARDKKIFNHLKGDEREVALQKYVADSIAKCIAPLISRERIHSAEKAAAAIAKQVAPLISSDKQRNQIARVIRNSKGGS